MWDHAERASLLPRQQKLWSCRKIILLGSSISSIGSISSSFLFKFPGFEDGVRVDLIIGFIVAILFPISPNFRHKSSHTHFLTQNITIPCTANPCPCLRRRHEKLRSGLCNINVRISSLIHGHLVLQMDVALVTVIVLRCYVWKEKVETSCFQALHPIYVPDKVYKKGVLQAGS